MHSVAIQIRRNGDADTLEFIEVAVPTPGEGEVPIRGPIGRVFSARGLSGGAQRSRRARGAVACADRRRRGGATLLRGLTAEYLLRRIAPVQPGDAVLAHAAAKDSWLSSASRRVRLCLAEKGIRYDSLPGRQSQRRGAGAGARRRSGAARKQHHLRIPRRHAAATAAAAAPISRSPATFASARWPPRCSCRPPGWACISISAAWSVMSPDCE